MPDAGAMMAAHPAWRLSSAKPAPRYRDHALGSRLFFSLPTGETMAVRSPVATPSHAAPTLILTAVPVTHLGDRSGLTA